MATQDDYIRTALRVPPTLHSQIHEAAKINNRTFNAEIIARLQQSFETRDVDLAQDTADAMLKALAQAVSHAENLAKRLEVIEKKRS